MTTRSRFITIATAFAITVGFTGNAHAMLLPAIQKVRDAAARSDADDRPTEEVAFYYNRIALSMVEEEILLGIEAGEIPPSAINGGLNRDIIRRRY